MFSRFDTIPAYAREMSTERQSASSGKNRRKVHSVGICNIWTKIRHTLGLSSITGRSVVEKQFNRIRKLSRLETFGNVDVETRTKVIRLAVVCSQLRKQRISEITIIRSAHGHRARLVISPFPSAERRETEIDRLQSCNALLGFLLQCVVSLITETNRSRGRQYTLHALIVTTKRCTDQSWD